MSSPDPSTQPFDVFFDLNIGGLSNIYHNPNIPLDFELDIGEKYEMKMTLYDYTGFDVEPYLWEAGQQGSCRFGYQGGSATDNIPFIGLHYDSIWQGNDFIDVLYAQMNRSPFLSCNQLNGTAENSLNDFCKIHGYQLQINPNFGTQYMQEVGKYSKFSTAKREMLHTKRQNETDWSYIQRLVQKCRDPQGRTGYVAHEATDGSGNKVLKVEMPPDGGADYHLIVQDASTDVVQWNPSISFAKGVFGAGDIHWNSHQAITGDYQKFNMQQKLMSDYMQLNGYTLKPLVQSSPPKDPCTQIIQAGGAENFESGSVRGAMRMRSPGSPSPYAGFNSALWGTQQSILGCNQATIVIQGDPSIEYLKSVQVDAFYPSTYKNLNDPRRLHYSSGLWKILGIKHNIARSGEFLTTLTLRREGTGTTPTPGKSGS